MTIDRKSLFLGAAAGGLAATSVARFGPELAERTSTVSLCIVALMAFLAAWAAWGPRPQR